VQCVVTSPPYWGLRDYGVAGQIGLEPTPGEYVARLVEAFREVRRVLADDGTLWLNLGDCYSGSGKGGNPDEAKQTTNRGSLSIGVQYGKTGETAREAALTNVSRRWTADEGIAPKNLIGIPWRVAFALQADGWYLRSDIIWAKPNPIPESVTDRPTKAHEYIFLLSKSASYYYDAEAIKEPVAESQVGRIREDVIGGTSHVERGQHSKGGTYRGSSFNRGKTGVNGNGRNQPDEERRDTEGLSDVRNKRSVWTVATQPFAGAHFAAFPPELIKPCILAGSKPGDTVLDPFAGAGTTGLVADRLARNALLIELNPVYAEMARRRIVDDAPLFVDVGGVA